MGLQIEPPVGEHTMWLVKQMRNGIPIDYYYGITREEAISKAVNDKKYGDDEKIEEKDETNIS